MNLLEETITEVHGISPYEEEWTKEFPDRVFYSVTCSSECYGQKRTETHVWNHDEMILNLDRGWFWS